MTVIYIQLLIFFLYVSALSFTFNIFFCLLTLVTLDRLDKVPSQITTGTFFTHLDKKYPYVLKLALTWSIDTKFLDYNKINF